MHFLDGKLFLKMKASPYHVYILLRCVGDIGSTCAAGYVKLMQYYYIFMFNF